MRFIVPAKSKILDRSRIQDLYLVNLIISASPYSVRKWWKSVLLRVVAPSDEIYMLTSISRHNIIGPLLLPSACRWTSKAMAILLWGATLQPKWLSAIIDQPKILIVIIFFNGMSWWCVFALNINQHETLSILRQIIIFARITPIAAISTIKIIWMQRSSRVPLGHRYRAFG